MSLTQSWTHRTLAWLLVVSLLMPLRAFADGGDDFTDPSKDPSKWGDDVMLGLGVLTEQHERLEYTCADPLSDGDTFRPWRLTRFPTDADWEIRVDTFNDTVPTLDFQVNSAGLVLYHPRTATSEISIELYSSSLGGPFSVRKGFDADLETDDVKIGDSDSGGLFGSEPVNGAVRLAFAASTKVVTCSYDTDVSDGYQWTDLASFGVAGAGGTTANTDWGVGPTDQFSLYVFGYSGGMVVSSGQIYLDNFVEIGGVMPTGPPSPVPTGSFRFAFPIGHPFLTAIFSINGNYRGVTRTDGRNYSFDVAQDESGKLTAMGTMDGIQNRDGGPEISGINGTIRSVNEEPMVQLRGNFEGTHDGTSASLNFKAAGQPEIVDIGAGTQGLAATASYREKLGGVPFSAKNVPFRLPTPLGTEENFRRDWSIQIDLSSKTIRGKQRTVASGRLLLPTGETIQYPEKVVRYSTTKGYRLKFRRGTNVTLNPPALDPKPKITIKGLTFVQQGGAWQPTGGMIGYQFLGQKGSGNLLDFVVS